MRIRNVANVAKNFRALIAGVTSRFLQLGGPPKGLSVAKYELCGFYWT